MENTNLDIPVRKMENICERVLAENSGNYEDTASRAELNDLINSFLNQQTHSGDADDWHNLAVTLSLRDEYKLACDILTCGIKYFPKNVDLLADYLLYGMDCAETEQCKKISQTLLSIPKRLWTWRGFSFLINYILQTEAQYAETDEDLDKILEKLLNIAYEYRKLFPASEDSYRVEATIYKTLNMFDKYIMILEQAMKEISVCPKCSLMYADSMFESGNYQEALKGVTRSIADASQLKQSVHDGYLYFLHGLCIVAAAQKNNDNLNEDVIINIYSDFNMALSFYDNSAGSGKVINYKDVIKNKMLYLINRYHINIPEEDVAMQNLANELNV